VFVTLRAQDELAGAEFLRETPVEHFPAEVALADSHEELESLPSRHHRVFLAECDHAENGPKLLVSRDQETSRILQQIESTAKKRDSGRKWWQP
jgi:hypothetical protein